MAWPKGLSKEEAAARKAAASAAPIALADAPAIEERAPTLVDLAKYDRWVYRGLDAQYQEACAKVHAVLVAEYGSDLADRMMTDIAPVLKDPQRESRRRPLRPTATLAT